MSEGHAQPNPDTRCLVAGHSHMFALGASIGYKGPLSFEPSAQWGSSVAFLMDEWRGDRAAQYWDKLVEHAAGRMIVLAYNGNQHYGDFLIAPDMPFDFLEPGCPSAGLIGGAMLVPRRLVQAHFDRTLVPLRQLVGRLVAAGSREVLILGTPAPKADSRRFMDVIRNSEFMKGVARKRGLDLDTVDLTPESLLLKMWVVIQELLSQSAHSTGARFIATPPRTQGADGFLAEHYVRPGDLTHANEDYGRLMMGLALHA